MRPFLIPRNVSPRGFGGKPVRCVSINRKVPAEALLQRIKCSLFNAQRSMFKGITSKEINTALPQPGKNPKQSWIIKQ